MTAATAEAVGALWAQVLELEKVEPDADFFALGGDSFTAMHLLALIEAETGVAVTFSDLLDAPVLQDFVARVEVQGKRGSGPRRRRTRSTAPLTLVQLQIWRNRRAPTSAEVYWLYEVEGPLDVDVLRRALDELALRHHILRTTMRQRFGRVRQVVHDSPPSLLRVVEATELPKRARTTAGAAQWVFEEDFGPFDYGKGPLLRATLVVLGPRRWVFSVAGNEMIIDGSSRRVFTTALNTLYKLILETGSAEAYPYPPVQFGDFARNLRKRVSRRMLLKQLSYWNDEVAGLERGLAVRGHELTPSVDWGRPIPDRSADLPPTVVRQVRATAQSLSTTSFNVLAAAFAVLLHAVADTDNPTFTTTVSHRELSGAEHLIGTFFNIVLVSVPVDREATAADLVRATAAATREAFVNRDVPISHVVREPLPDASLLDVTKVRFQLHEDPGDLCFEGVRMRRIPPPFKPTHELYLAATATAEGGLSLYFSCRPDMPRPFVHAFVGTFRRVVEAITEDLLRPVADLVDVATRALTRP